MHNSLSAFTIIFSSSLHSHQTNLLLFMFMTGTCSYFYVLIPDLLLTTGYAPLFVS